jgi:hypothetical protein
MGQFEPGVGIELLFFVTVVGILSDYPSSVRS